MNYNNTTPLENFIEELQSLDNPYIYHKNLVDDKYVASMKYSTKDKASFAYNNHKFTMSDLFIAMAVAKLNFASTSVIGAYVDWYKRQHPGQAVISKDSVKGRSKNLLNNGLMTKFSFNIGDDKIRHGFYTLTSLGYNIMRNVLHYKDGYNEYTSFVGADEIVKQLAVNSVIKYMLDADTVTEFSCNKSLYNPNIGKKKLFGYVKTSVNDVKHKVIVEPFYFGYDTARVDKADVLQYIRDRLALIFEYVKKTEADGGKISVVFVCEDINRVAQAMSHIAKKDMHILARSYFTTSPMCYKYGFENSMLSFAELTPEGKVASFTNKVKEPFC